MLEENRNLLRTIQIVNRLNCLLKVPLSLCWPHGEPQESTFLSTLAKHLRLRGINLDLMRENIFLHGPDSCLHICPVSLYTAYASILRGLNVHFGYLGPLLDITLTNGGQKEGSMKMAVCSTVFSSRHSALCIYSGILQSVQHVPNPAPTGMMLHIYILSKYHSTVFIKQVILLSDLPSLKIYKNLYWTHIHTYRCIKPCISIMGLHWILGTR